MPNQLVVATSHSNNSRLSPTVGQAASRQDKHALLVDYLELLRRDGCPTTLVARREFDKQFYKSNGLHTGMPVYKSISPRISDIHKALQTNTMPKGCLNYDVTLKAKYAEVLDAYKRMHKSPNKSFFSLLSDQVIATSHTNNSPIVPTVGQAASSLDKRTILEDYLDLLLRDGYPTTLAARREFNKRFYNSSGLLGKTKLNDGIKRGISYIHVALQTNSTALPRGIRYDAALTTKYKKILTAYKLKLKSTNKETSPVAPGGNKTTNNPRFVKNVNHTVPVGNKTPKQLKSEELKDKLMNKDCQAEKMKREVENNAEETEELSEKAYKQLEDNKEEVQKMVDEREREMTQILLTIHLEKEEEMKKTICRLETELAQALAKSKTLELKHRLRDFEESVKDKMNRKFVYTFNTEQNKTGGTFSTLE